MLKTVTENIKSMTAFTNAPLLIGVSGGADSLALMDTLHKIGFNCIVAHFNHNLRETANQDAEIVRQSATKHDFQFVLGQADVNKYAAENKLSIEEAARILRYQFLFEQAKLHNSKSVCVAHNANDQAETVLMHLLNGTGLDGLSGMEMISLNHTWSSKIALVRPLLNIWRVDIEAYCKSNQLNPIIDESNNNLDYFRNQIRHEVLPYLMQINPNISTSLWQTAEIAQAERAVIETQLDVIWYSKKIEVGHNFVAFELPTFLSVPRAIQRRLVRRAVSSLVTNSRNFGYSATETFIDFAAEPSNSKNISLPVNLWATLETNILFLHTKDAIIPTDNVPQLDNDLSDIETPIQVALAGGWQLSITKVNLTERDLETIKKNRNPHLAWLQTELIPNISIKKPILNNSFAPLGMGGNHKNINEFFSNHKIPIRLRENWPVVYLNDTIAWVVGLRSTEDFRVQTIDLPALKLKVSKPNE